MSFVVQPIPCVTVKCETPSVGVTTEAICFPDQLGAYFPESRLIRDIFHFKSNRGNKIWLTRVPTARENSQRRA